MTKFAIAVAVVCASCGSVAPETDAPVAAIDARVDAGAVDALTCTIGFTPCNGQCVDTQTDERFCGGCTTACTMAQGCLSGGCVDATASCAVIKALDPTAPSGPYTNQVTAQQFYCDMRGPVMMYEELGFGQYNVSHPGFDLVTVADLNDTVIQQAYIFLYNLQGGLRTITPWASSNCCIRGSLTAATVFQIAGGAAFPALTAADMFQCNGTYGEARYRFWLTAANVYVPIPMPTDFFLLNPVSEMVNCADGSNPAFFFRRHL